MRKQTALDLVVPIMIGLYIDFVLCTLFVRAHTAILAVGYAFGP